MSSEPSRPSRSTRRATVRLPAQIARTEVPSIVARCLETARSGERLTADCRNLVEPELPAVEVLARLALASHRTGRRFRLEHASQPLLDLVRLCGLEASLRIDPG
jgi:hypothetical protein